MDKIADFLIEKETITGKEFMEIFRKVQEEEKGETEEKEAVEEKEAAQESEATKEKEEAQGD